MQSLYPERPRGGLTVVPSRHPAGADPQQAGGLPNHGPITCSHTTRKGLPGTCSYTTRIQGLWLGYQLVHLSSADAEPLSRTATWRPDFRPVSSLFQQCRPLPSGKRTLQSNQIPFSAFGSFGGETQLCASFDKSAPPRTLPVVHTAPWPHALWSIL